MGCYFNVLWYTDFSETHTQHCTRPIQNLQRTLDAAAMKYGHEKGWK